MSAASWGSMCACGRDSDERVRGRTEDKLMGLASFLQHGRKGKSCRGDPLWPPLSGMQELSRSDNSQSGATTEGRPYMKILSTDFTVALLATSPRWLSRL